MSTTISDIENDIEYFRNKATLNPSSETAQERLRILEIAFLEYVLNRENNNAASED